MSTYVTSLFMIKPPNLKYAIKVKYTLLLAYISESHMFGVKTKVCIHSFGGILYLPW